jgi:hypothetical protein
LIEQYETLRAAALGDQLPVEARSGLALFLRRGMWGWVRTAVVPRAAAPTRRSIPRSSPSENDQTVIHLLASMVMRSWDTRTYERLP